MSSLQLKLEIDEVQKEHEEVERRITEKMLPKITAKRNSAKQEFEEFFTKHGFSISHTVGEIVQDRSVYPEDIITADVSGIYYELRIPDLRVNYLGAYTVLTINQGTKYELKVGISGSALASWSKAYGRTDNSEAGRLKIDLEMAKDRLEEAKKRESNLDNTPGIYWTKPGKTVYNSFTDILKEYTK
jgi:hypothetical protein